MTTLKSGNFVYGISCILFRTNCLHVSREKCHAFNFPVRLESLFTAHFAAHPSLRTRSCWWVTRLIIRHTPKTRFIASRYGQNVVIGGYFDGRFHQKDFFSNWLRFGENVRWLIIMSQSVEMPHAWYMYGTGRTLKNFDSNTKISYLGNTSVAASGLMRKYSIFRNCDLPREFTGFRSGLWASWQATEALEQFYSMINLASGRLS